MASWIREFPKVKQRRRYARMVDWLRRLGRALGLVDPQTPQTPQPVESLPAPAPAPEAVLAPVLKLASPVEDTAAPQPGLPARPDSFAEHVFRFGDADYAYRLYLPGASGADLLSFSSLPLVVLLHGCKQNATDFAQGTAMNALAEQEKCIVLYPEQLSTANAMRCWNWFEPAHQARDSGEPGMIAALTRQVIQSHNADPARVYVAGLSAGGAMAAVVAGLYPELFAAVGVHSGIPTGAASNVVSAFGAMRRGARRSTLAREQDGMTPTIVFHGSADQTVHPGNGEQIAQAALTTLEASGFALEKIERVVKSADAPAVTRSTRRTRYRAADGKSWIEHWVVESGPHAWSGGKAAGSFTDPQGPDASQAILAFFLQHHQ